MVTLIEPRAGLTMRLLHPVADLSLEEALHLGRDVNKLMRTFGKA